MASLADTVMREKKERSGGNLAKNILLEARTAWENLSERRKNYYRCNRFKNGDQWGDKTEFNRRTCTEREAIIEQGRYPVTNNRLKILVRNYKGAYIKQDLEPTCQARDLEEQYLCDALTTSLQYNWDLNSQKELNADVFEEGLSSGFLGFKVSIGIFNGKYDVWCEKVSLPRFFVNTNATDPRGMDAELIGEIHDMTKSTLLSTYSKSASDRRRIEDIYKQCADRGYMASQYRQFGKAAEIDDFLYPNDFGLCRVIEVWKKEFRDGYWCHDFLTGELYGVRPNELAEIEQTNALRLKQAREVGISEDIIKEAKENGQSYDGSVKLIKYTYFYEDYWYYRMLAPNGEVLDEGESPYAHKSHPYDFRFYSETSFLCDVIPLQKNLNRNLTMRDWIMRHSAKGALLFPEDQMADGWTLDMYGNAWARPDVVIPYKPKAGAAIPQQISKNNTDIGIYQSISEDLEGFENITGIQGVLQGKSGLAGTSGSMYAMQTENANTSILDLLSLMSAIIKEVATKQIQCMQQCYDDKKFEQIVGRTKALTRSLEGIHNVVMDVRMAESASSLTYRGVTNDKLDLFLQLGMIDIMTYLRHTTLPFGYELANDLAQQQQEALANGQQPLPTAVPQQAAEAAVAGANDPQAGANNIYNMMNKK